MTSGQRCDWSVHAIPDGSLKDMSTSREYPYLFWEADSTNGLESRSFGLEETTSFCVAGKDSGSDEPLMYASSITYTMLFCCIESAHPHRPIAVERIIHICRRSTPQLKRVCRLHIVGHGQVSYGAYASLMTQQRGMRPNEFHRMYSVAAARVGFYCKQLAS